MRIGDPLTLVVPQCHHSCLKKVPRVLRNDLYCLELELVHGAEFCLNYLGCNAEPVDVSAGSGTNSSADAKLEVPYRPSEQAAGYLLSSGKFLSNCNYFSGTSWLMNSHAVDLLFGKGVLGTLNSTSMPSSKYWDISPDGKYS